MKDSILEKALLQAKVLEEAIKTNAKGILADTMKQEINSLVKESLEDEMSSDEETDIADKNPFAGNDDDENDVDAADEDNAESDSEDSEEDEMSADDKSGDLGIGADDEESDDEFSELPAEDDELDSDDETIDMTNASDDEVLSIFKKMGEEDGIVVQKKDDNSVELTINDEDFLVKINEDEELEEDETEEIEEQDEEVEGEEAEMCEDEEEIEEEENEEEEEPLYEIVFDDEDDFGLGSNDAAIDLTGGDEFGIEDNHDMIPNDDNLSIEGDTMVGDETSNDPLGTDAEFMEISRTIGLGARPGSLPKGAKAATKVSREALSEAKELKSQNKLLKEKVEDYKKALGLFRDKLNEVAVFNANLAYATRLFTEHSTTKQEKMEILKRFDNTSTLKESQTLYKTIKTELNSKPTITESVASKIVKTPSNGSSANSKEMLAESKAYESPQFARMKDLFNKLK
jgi:hypothetical protein